MALQVVQVVGSLHASQLGSHGGGSHDAVMGSSVYPELHDPQVSAPSVVQAPPVAGVPSVQVQAQEEAILAELTQPDRRLLLPAHAPQTVCLKLLADPNAADWGRDSNPRAQERKKKTQEEVNKKEIQKKTQRMTAQQGQQ